MNTNTQPVQIDVSRWNMTLDKITATLKADPGFTQELSAHGRRKDENAVASCVMALHVGQNVDPQLIMSAPEPGSEATSEVNGKTIVTNSNPDYYKRPDGKGGTEEVSFYGLMVQAMPAGIDNENELRLLRASKEPIGEQTDDGNVVRGDGNPYRDLDDEDRKKRIAACVAKRGTLRAACADAFGICKMFRLVKDIENVDVEIETKPGEPLVVVTGTYSPIRLIDMTRSKSAYFNAKGFLALRPWLVTDDNIQKVNPNAKLEEIKKYGGAWIVLKNSAPPRKKKGDGQTPGTTAAGGSKYPLIQSSNDFYDYALTGANFFNLKKDDGSKAAAAILTYIADAVKNNKSEIITGVGDMIMGLDPIWKILEQPYLRIKESEAATAAQEAADRKAAADKITATHNAQVAA